MQLREKLTKKVNQHYRMVSRELERLLIKNHGVVRFKVEPEVITELKNLCSENPHWPINVIIAEVITEQPTASPEFLEASLLMESKNWFKLHSLMNIIDKFSAEHNVSFAIETEDIITDSHSFKLITQITMTENHSEENTGIILHD